MKNNLSYTPYAETDSGSVAKYFVDGVLSKGFKLDVWNGGKEAEILGSRDKHAILEAMFATADDSVVVRNADSERVGDVHFNYALKASECLANWQDPSAVGDIVALAHMAGDRYEALDDLSADDADAVEVYRYGTFRLEAGMLTLTSADGTFSAWQADDLFTELSADAIAVVRQTHVAPTTFLKKSRPGRLRTQSIRATT